MKSLRRTAAALIVALAGTACSQPDSDQPAQSGTLAGADASSPSGASAPAPGTVNAGAASAVAAYRDMWRAFANAATTGDWTSAEMARFATGEALSTLTQGIKADHDRGWVSRGQPALAPSVKNVTPHEDPKEVLVSDCGDSTNWIRYEANSGRAVPDDPRGRRRIEAIVTKQEDGAWRVAKFAVQGIGTC